LVRPSVQNAPGKIGETSPAGYTHGKAAKRSPKTRWSDDIAGLAWSCLGKEPAELSKIAVGHEEISSSPRTAAPFVLPRGKVGRKINEKMNIHGSIHDNAQIKLISTLSQLLDFVFMTTRVASLPQNTFSNCMLCRTWQAMWKFP